MAENNNNNSNTLKIGLIVLLGALGLLGYLYYNAQTKNADLQKLLTGKMDELSTTKARLDSISVELDQKIAEIQALGGSIEELQHTKAQLEQDKLQLSKDVNFSSKKYESKINEYKRFLSSKDSEIARLKEENGVLTNQNTTLQEEKQKVIAENTSLYQTKDSLDKKVSEVSSDNEELRQKVNVGAALKAVNVKVTAINPRGKEKTGEVKNRKIDQLKVTFILSSNPLTATNSKDIFYECWILQEAF